MPTNSDKYSAKDPLFDEEHGVLKNLLGITDKDDLYSIEIKNLTRAYKAAALLYETDHHFTATDVCALHKIFLGTIYTWAGNYRDIDISSPGIRYCHASYIPENMKAFSKRLTELTPFHDGLGKEEITRRVAEIHGELILIHPFRDGNGRTTRLLCDLLLMQAGYNPLDTSIFYDKKFIDRYHHAIQSAWHSGDYAELISLFSPLIG